MTSPSRLSGLFGPLLEQERDLLLRLANAPPLQSVESANEAAYAELLESLLAESGARHVVQLLHKQHTIYARTFDPRAASIARRVRRLRSATGGVRENLQRLSNALGPVAANQLSQQISQLRQAEGEMKGVGKGVAKHLNAILRRGKRNRVLLDSLHALLVLGFFSIGFGWLGDSVCTWAAAALRVPSLPQQTCLLLWAIVTLILFAAERWFAGPIVDRWMERRITRSTEVVLGRYFVERTRLEYRMAVLEHETTQMETRLQGNGLL